MATVSGEAISVGNDAQLTVTNNVFADVATPIAVDSAEQSGNTISQNIGWSTTPIDAYLVQGENSTQWQDDNNHLITTPVSTTNTYAVIADLIAATDAAVAYATDNRLI